jgi:outer membrane protein assembly factor BamB
LISFTVLFGFAALAAGQPPPVAADRGPELLEAAQRLEISKVRQLLEDGVDVNSKSRYGATALSFACDKGSLELVELLLDRGAEIDVEDSFYQATPLSWAFYHLDKGGEYKAIALLLLGRGARDAGTALTFAVRATDPELAQAALANGHLKDEEIGQALALARTLEETENLAKIIALLQARAPKETPAPPALALSAAELQAFAGLFKNEQRDLAVEVRLEGETLQAQIPGQPPWPLVPTGEGIFRAQAEGAELTFAGRGGLIETLRIQLPNQEILLSKADAPPPSQDKPAPAPAAEAPPVPTRAPGAPWPSFRGPNASGIADGQGALWRWDGKAGLNVLWKTEIPGLGLSSPVVWGQQIFVTSAESERSETTFRTGLYGDVDSVEDDSVHRFQVYALDKNTGKVLWQRTATSGRPKVKRHLKSSHANPTPVTDGRYVVVHFGSEGVFCYDLDGTQRWHKDLGVLSSGWFYDPTYEWGFSSSPILYQGRVILQTDRQQGSFLAALDLETGKELWRTTRDEIPTWGTPSILPGASHSPDAPKGSDEIVTNGTTIRGYDAATGRELWTLRPNSEVTVATPVVADGVAFVTAGYPPARPIYAIRPGGRGDLSLPEGATASQHIAWSVEPGGTYIPTPVAYRGILYTLNNNGRLATYDTATGELIYRQRLGRADSFSSSPVAADGRLYFTSEDGKTFVVRAGRDFEELAVNELDEVVLSTPAISDGLLVLRGMKHVFGIGLGTEPAAAAGEKPPVEEIRPLETAPAPSATLASGGDDRNEAGDPAP